MKNTEKIRFGIRKKIVLPVVGVVLIVCTFMGIIIYTKVKEKMIEKTGEDALVVAEVIGKMLDFDMLKQAIDSDQNENYQAMVEVMQEIEMNQNIAYAYIVGPIENSIHYLVTSKAGDRRVLEECWQQDVWKAMSGDSIYATEIEHTKEYGDLLTVYTPLYDSNGEIIAVMALDFSADGVVKILNNILVLITLVEAALCFGSIFLMSSVINRLIANIRRIDSKLQELVSNNGDLTKRLEINTKDELGQIGGLMNRLLEFIRNVIVNISDISVHLNDSMKLMNNSMKESSQEVEAVSSTMEQMSAMMQQTYASTEHISVVMDKMQKSVSDVNQEVDTGRKIADDINDKAREVLVLADHETSIVKEETQQLVAELEEKIKASYAVYEIEKLSKHILDITDQTALLALNASIEAARAGDAGRSFTVVAQEMSKLAANSANAATEIQRMSATVIESVDGLAEKSQKMVQYVSDKTVKGYEELLNVGNKYTESSQQIRDLYQRLGESMTQIESGMQSIGTSTKEVTEAVKESTNGVTQISESAIHLNDMIHENTEMTNENKGKLDQLVQEVNRFIV